MADPSTVDQLITYGVPGSIALAGVWLGKVWERRGGAASWRRDERLKAYTDFLDTSHALWAQATLMYRNTLTLTQAMIEEINVHGFKAGRDSSRIQILGTDGVWDASEEMMRRHRALTELVSTRGVDNSVPLAKTPPGVAMLEGEARFIEAAQKALG